MDAKEYDRFADILMQFRGKLPKWLEINHVMAKHHVRDTTILIDSLLGHLDSLAKMDDRGWLR